MQMMIGDESSALALQDVLNNLTYYEIVQILIDCLKETENKSCECKVVDMTVNDSGKEKCRI